MYISDQYKFFLYMLKFENIFSEDPSIHEWMSYLGPLHFHIVIEKIILRCPREGGGGEKSEKAGIHVDFKQ